MISFLRVLAIILLLCSIFNWPYGYYQILRWVVFGVAVYSSYQFSKDFNNKWTWIFGIIAILFNPFTPFYFNKGIWLILDYITAVIFILKINTYFYERKN